MLLFLLLSIGLLPIDKALSLTTYLRKEDKIMPVFQGMNELIPIYKLMEKRDMKEIEEQMKVSSEKTTHSLPFGGNCFFFHKHLTS